jgi:hypothetical protein
MIVIVRHPLLTAGLADSNEERREARAQRMRVFRRAGHYGPEVIDDTDEADDTAHVFIARAVDDGTLLAAAHYYPQRAGRLFNVEQAYKFTSPKAVDEVPLERRIEGDAIVVEHVMPDYLCSIGMIATSFLYYLTVRTHDVTLNASADRWISHLQRHDFVFHAIEGAELRYPKDGQMAAFFHASPKPRCFYASFTENEAATRACCARLGFTIEPPFSRPAPSACFPFSRASALPEVCHEM